MILDAEVDAAYPQRWLGRVTVTTTDGRTLQGAIDELGFVRNATARQLRRGAAQTVGVIVLDLSNPFYTELARGIEANCYSLLDALLRGPAGGR